MSIAIRTLSPQDAEMLARTIVTGVVSNGCVERYDLTGVPMHSGLGKYRSGGSARNLKFRFASTS